MSHAALFLKALQCNTALGSLPFVHTEGKYISAATFVLVEDFIMLNRLDQTNTRAGENDNFADSLNRARQLEMIEEEAVQ